ncbi:T9SS type A sorting domain-containing protein [Dokdonia sp.]|uniref:T9SS type A sorting domain-containing protein n=1 Tax=Dokdonia sp. TaxID=2024995 RepID=UPI003266087F
MKKYRFLILFICFITSQNIFAQIPELFIHEWELDHLIIDDEEIFPPINEEVESVRILFDETPNDNPNTPYSITGNVCDTFFSSVIFEHENTIETLRMGFDYVETLGGCDISENLNFQGTYFSFYVNFLEDPYEYQITFSGDDALSLEVFSPNGDIAIYNNLTLSVNDITEISFSIYPNPVQDQLHITTNQSIRDYTMTIFDMQGRVLIRRSRETLGINPITIQDWRAGIYLVKIENASGAITTKRFIKN